MPQTDVLRASRDGDQFHYHWAARHALKLLRPGTRLAALVIEGVSEDDTDDQSGEEVIDLAEYWGTDRLADAESVIYRQFKHSTSDANAEFTSSFLKKTLVGFAKKFRAVLDEAPEAVGRVRFEFVSNRPASEEVRNALADIAASTDARNPTVVAYIKLQLTDSLDETEIVEFCRWFTIDDRAPRLLALREALIRDVGALLPGAPGDQHILLKEMVADRASSIAGHDPVVTKSTVLSALRVTAEQLLPAPNEISPPDYVVVTDPMRAVAEQLVSFTGGQMVVHAAGGIGKTVLAVQLPQSLPLGTLTFVYDCFGNGGYRKLSGHRHEHRRALVQLSNELAASSLCDPVIPSATATADDYMRIFLHRLGVAAETLRAEHPDAMLLLIVDAADNAAMIENEVGTRAFVADLLREDLPANVRLLMLCRTERVHLLQPPPTCLQIELHGFGPAETRQYLHSRLGAVSDADAAEFHRRTGGNPRVQALVLETATSIADALASLGEARNLDGDILEGLLQNQLDRIKDTHGRTSDEVDRLCAALAALRPRIPIGVLARICDVDPALIRSFVADLGRPLLVDGDAVQFRDEPTETWFRKRFRPTGDALLAFVERLRPLATVDAYVAASLPQLYFEAERVDELVALAISEDALPEGGDLERREVAQQRAQFALKATLRAGRDLDAARLTLRAGALEAGHTRRLNLIRTNTDLASEFLDPHVIESLVATRSLAGDWPGSHLHFEGGLLSGADGQSDFARNRLRSAQDWMHAWVRQAHEQHKRHDVTMEDIAEVGLGVVNTDGPAACVEYLSRWQPPYVAFQAGVLIASRLVDHGRTAELEELAWQAERLKQLQLAVMQAACAGNIILGQRGVRRVVAMLKRHRRRIDLKPDGYTWPPADIRTTTEFKSGLNSAVAIILVSIPGRGPVRPELGRPRPAADPCRAAAPARARHPTSAASRTGGPAQRTRLCVRCAAVPHERGATPRATKV